MRYLDRHSGGRQSIVTLCGQDGTASFDSVSHPTSYITMMTQKRWATMKGRVIYIYAGMFQEACCDKSKLLATLACVASYFVAISR